MSSIPTSIPLSWLAFPVFLVAILSIVLLIVVLDNRRHEETDYQTIQSLSDQLRDITNSRTHYRTAYESKLEEIAKLKDRLKAFTETFKCRECGQVHIFEADGKLRALAKSQSIKKI
jgi:hypothetical protein